MIIIGEKCNGSIPTVAEAIRTRDESLIRARAKAQADAGADYIDVCASVPVDEEAEVLAWMIGLVQSVTDTPICIDSPNPAALVNAMQLCRRPGMLNSVSMEPGKIETVFPAIRDTQWRCVALLCDGDGIPATAERRVEVFERILKEAAAYGVEPERLFFDPLVVALSTDPGALRTFLHCCRSIRERSPEAHITSGLSNISFGLPARKYINQAFMVLAKGAGMDSAIADPTNEDMRGLIAAADTLLGGEASAMDYIAAYRKPAAQDAPKQAAPAAESPAPAASVPQGVRAVYDAVCAGHGRTIDGLVAAALAAGEAPSAVLNDGMIAAMRALGERFSRGEAFIPEMLMAARAMKRGVEELKPHLSAGAAGAAGTVVIGTVAGDQHDIGKNLVAMMLESAGFTVLDLGSNVAAEAFVNAVDAHPEAGIVALSALLTTTMPAMRDIVQALRAHPRGNELRIMVGGAPVTAAFAQEIGADAFGEDAAVAAEIARRFAAEGARHTDGAERA